MIDRRDRRDQQRLQRSALALPADSIAHDEGGQDADGHRELQDEVDRLALLKKVQGLIGRRQVRDGAQQNAEEEEQHQPVHWSTSRGTPARRRQAIRTGVRHRLAHPVTCQRLVVVLLEASCTASLVILRNASDSRAPSSSNRRTGIPAAVMAARTSFISSPGAAAVQVGPPRDSAHRAALLSGRR